MLEILTALDNFKEPYDGAGRCTFKRADWYGIKGCYVIREKSTEQIVYVGMSTSCIYRRCYRHFANWCKERSDQKWFDRSKGYEIVLCYDSDPEFLEQMLIGYFMPPVNNCHFKTSLLKKSDNFLKVEPVNKISYFGDDYDLINSYKYATYNV